MVPNHRVGEKIQSGAPLCHVNTVGLEKTAVITRGYYSRIRRGERTPKEIIPGD